MSRPEQPQPEQKNTQQAGSPDAASTSTRAHGVAPEQQAQEPLPHGIVPEAVVITDPTRVNAPDAAAAQGAVQATAAAESGAVDGSGGESLATPEGTADTSGESTGAEASFSEGDGTATTNTNSQGTESGGASPTTADTIASTIILGGTEAQRATPPPVDAAPPTDGGTGHFDAADPGSAVNAADVVATEDASVTVFSPGDPGFAMRGEATSSSDSAATDAADAAAAYGAEADSSTDTDNGTSSADTGTETSDTATSDGGSADTSDTTATTTTDGTASSTPESDTSADTSNDASADTSTDTSGASTDTADTAPSDDGATSDGATQEELPEPILGTTDTPPGEEEFSGGVVKDEEELDGTGGLPPVEPFVPQTPRSSDDTPFVVEDEKPELEEQTPDKVEPPFMQGPNEPIEPVADPEKPVIDGKKDTDAVDEGAITEEVSQVEEPVDQEEDASGSLETSAEDVVEEVTQVATDVVAEPALEHEQPQGAGDDGQEGAVVDTEEKDPESMSGERDEVEKQQDQVRDSEPLVSDDEEKDEDEDEDEEVEKKKVEKEKSGTQQTDPEKAGDNEPDTSEQEAFDAFVAQLAKDRIDAMGEAGRDVNQAAEEARIAAELQASQAHWDAQVTNLAALYRSEYGMSAKDAAAAARENITSMAANISGLDITDVRQVASALFVAEQHDPEGTYDRAMKHKSSGVNMGSLERGISERRVIMQEKGYTDDDVIVRNESGIRDKEATPKTLSDYIGSYVDENGKVQHMTAIVDVFDVPKGSTYEKEYNKIVKSMRESFLKGEKGAFFDPEQAAQRGELQETAREDGRDEVRQEEDIYQYDDRTEEAGTDQDEKGAKEVRIPEDPADRKYQDYGDDEED